MFSNIQKGSLTGLNKPTVRAAFFILSFVLVHLYFLLVVGAQASETQSTQQASLVQPLPLEQQPVKVREYKLNYDIGFWIFPQVGVGVATLERMDNPATYVVTLEAHPVGIFASFVKRQVIYQTVMEFDRENNRLRPLSSSQKRIKDSKTKDKTIKFDYVKGVCIFEYRENDVLKKEKVIPFPSDATPDDPITAFHNLCNGAYGEIKEGSIYNIKVMVKENPSNLTFKVCSTDCKNECALPKDEENDFGFAAKINVVPEIVDSTKGEIFVCFSNGSIPLAVKVKDVIGFGDIYGVLVNKVYFSEDSLHR